MKQPVILMTRTERDIPLKSVLVQFLIEIRTDDKNNITLFKQDTYNSGYMTCFGKVNCDHFTDQQLDQLMNLNEYQYEQKQQIIDILCTVDEKHYKINVPPHYEDA